MLNSMDRQLTADWGLGEWMCVCVCVCVGGGGGGGAEIEN